MRGGWGALLLALAVPAHAEEARYSLFNPVPADQLRPFCSDSPGFGIPTCIVDAGHVIVWKTDAAIDDDHVVAVFKRGHVFPDFAHASERYNL